MSKQHVEKIQAQQFKICVRLINTEHVLTYTVSSYSIHDGMVFFTDEKTKLLKIFACQNVQIEEVASDD